MTQNLNSHFHQIVLKVLLVKILRIVLEGVSREEIHWQVVVIVSDPPLVNVHPQSLGGL